MTTHQQSTLAPAAAQMVQSALNTVPMNATVGVTITAVGVGWATGQCPDTAPYRNHIGSIHAGAQFLLAEAVSAAAFVGAFAQQFSGSTPLIEKLETAYVARAKGDLQARAEVVGDIAAAHAEYEQHGKARLDVQVSVSDSEGKEVMQAKALWYIRKNAR